MIIRVPITGKLVSYDPEKKTGVGDDKNKIRPLDFGKLFPDAFFKWEVKAFDIESATALVEITFEKKITVLEFDDTKKPPEPLMWKTETDLEFFTRQADTLLAMLPQLVKTPDELYQLTGGPKREMPCQ